MKNTQLGGSEYKQITEKQGAGSLNQICLQQALQTQILYPVTNIEKARWARIHWRKNEYSVLELSRAEGAMARYVRREVGSLSLTDKESIFSGNFSFTSLENKASVT
ncbi:hypothetical protein F2Q69_00043247 [Brassica cretica]|uniref:Uncharacterized protein n=1 Tax=Brassica cretica TaxID=69181 RepID=A0A8S9N5R6_BRACR|nr:hypothetical protein F2Q69_00043247 [Brassica cretica]